MKRKLTAQELLYHQDQYFQIKNWIKKNYSISFLVEQESEFCPQGSLASSMVLDSSISEGGCTSMGGPIQWFNGELTWDQICAGGSFIDSNENNWDLEYFSMIITELPADSNVCFCTLESNQIDCEQDIEGEQPITDCSVLSQLTPYQLNKFCTKCSDPTQIYGAVGPYAILDPDDHCPCCENLQLNDTPPDKIQWACLQGVSKFCLPVPPPESEMINPNDLPTMFPTQEICVSNTSCYEGTYTGTGEFLSNLPWPTVSEERKIQKGKNILREILQNRANIKKRG